MALPSVALERPWSRYSLARCAICVPKRGSDGDTQQNGPVRRFASLGHFVGVGLLRPSGGGGSRTRVRESIHRSVYVRIALLCSLPDPARTRPTQASCLKISSSLGQHHRRTSPNFRRLQESPRAGSSGDGLQGKDESLRSQCQVIVGSCKVSRWIYEVPGPRHAAPISPNTSKP